MYDITAIGELLIDFTPSGKSENNFPMFEANPGGAPANVLACATKLGAKTSFIGKVGNDSFGSFLKGVLDGIDIDTTGLVLDGKVETTLAFVHLSDDGDRAFSFYRSNGADKALEIDDINQDIINDSKIIHFGALSLTDEPARTAVLQTIQRAKKNGKIISFDPNWRESLWKSKEEAVSLIRRGLALSNIVKLSEEELELLTSTKDVEIGIDSIIKDNPNISVLAVTLGSEGCYISNRTEKTFLKSVSSHNGKPLKIIDTTGAGDCFMGSLLVQILKSEKEIEKIDIDFLRKSADFANRAASICITRRGGIPSMPTLDDVASI